MAEPITLRALGREETQLLARVGSVEGTMEVKTAALAGVSQAYATVHRNYVELAENGDLEALKRAVFLQWFAVVEPPFLTGLSDLDQGSVARAMAVVDRLCAAGALDDELAWMLPYYYLIAEWAFPPGEECPHFAAYCKTNEPKGLVQPPASTQLAGRGQMGDYWQSVQRSRAGG